MPLEIMFSLSFAITLWKWDASWDTYTRFIFIIRNSWRVVGWLASWGSEVGRWLCVWIAWEMCWRMFVVQLGRICSVCVECIILVNGMSVFSIAMYEICVKMCQHRLWQLIFYISVIMYWHDINSCRFNIKLDFRWSGILHPFG